MWAELFAFFALLAVGQSEQALRTCEPIRVKTCQDMGYNVTGMPNFAGHDMQSDADFTLQTFAPLVQYGCSAQLQRFLCSVYVPMCTEKVPEPIGPCRSLCETVRTRCVPVLQGFGFAWPAALNCSKFPRENNHEHMCMEGPGEKDLGVPAVPPPAGAKFSRPYNHISPCAKYVKPSSYVFVNRTGRCTPLCERDVLFTAADKKLTEIWLSVSAGICFLCSVLALLMLMVDSNGPRFRYPERPMAFLTICYVFISIGWGIRAIAGRTAVSCVPDLVYPARQLLAQDGLRNAKCAVMFILLHYFGNAGAIWWVVLTVTWFLSATRGWTHERIQQHSSLFHLAGWGLPAFQTIAILVLRDVDADELTGGCFVGHQSTQSLLIFVLLPQFIYLVLAVSLLSCGIVTISRGKKVLSDKAQAVMIRLSVFGFLYTLPVAGVVASLFYEYHSRDEWLFVPEKSHPQPKPSIWVFIARIFLSLVFGIISLVWVWSPRAIEAGALLFRRFGGRGPYKQAPVKIQTMQYFEPKPVRPMHKHKTAHVHSHRKNRHDKTVITAV